MKEIHFAIFLILSALIIATSESKNVLMCYVMSWSVYRPDEGKFDVGEIDAHLCTHIIYAYRELNSTTWQMESGDVWADTGVGNIKKLVGLKRENPNLKILLCIGGWSDGSAKYSEMVESQQHRKTFVDSVMQYLEKNKLDGLDIDWQYPTKRGGKPEDKDNFVTLLQELRKEFDKVNFTLSVRLMGSRYASEGYNLPGVSDAVHYINLRSYSYHGTWESETGVHSPLTSKDEDNVEFSLNYMLGEGVDREKLLLGLSTEGNAFVLENPVTDGNYIGRATKEGFKGSITDECGTLGFNEICWELTKNGWNEFWDISTKTPYAVKGGRFVSFDNARSVQEKMRLVNKNNLGGVSVYSLDKDDFRGTCYGQTFVLTSTAKRSLHSISYQSAVLNQQFP